MASTFITALTDLEESARIDIEIIDTLLADNAPETPEQLQALCTIQAAIRDNIDRMREAKKLFGG